jgi:hypothetical protein
MALKATEYTVSALAVELKMDKRKVGQLLEGLEPHRKSGRVQYYWLREVFDHIRAKDQEKLDANQEQAKLSRSRRIKLDQEIALAGGETCETATVEKHWADVLVNIKNNFLALPHRTTHRVMACKEMSEGMAILEKAVREILENLADTGIPSTTPKLSVEQEPEAPAENNSKRVGRQRKKTVKRG